MRPVIRHILVIALIILESGISCANLLEAPVVPNGIVATSTPQKALGHRNRTGVLEKDPKKKRQRVLGHLSDQGIASTLQSAAVNGSVDGGKAAPTESEIQLRKALRQKRRKLKRLWQEIERIQRVLKSTDANGRQRNGNKTETDDGKAKAKMKNRKSHWRRRMMQRLKLLSRQLQEQQQQQQQQQRPSSSDTMEKLYALLALEPPPPPDGQLNRRGNSVADRNGRQPTGRRRKKNRGQHQKQYNSTAAARTPDSVSVTTRSPLSRYGAGDAANRTMYQALTGRHRQLPGVGSRAAAKSPGVANSGRHGTKKGDAGSTCVSHKNCKPGKLSVCTLAVEWSRYGYNTGCCFQDSAVISHRQAACALNTG